MIRDMQTGPLASSVQKKTLIIAYVCGQARVSGKSQFKLIEYRTVNDVWIPIEESLLSIKKHFMWVVFDCDRQIHHAILA